MKLSLAILSLVAVGSALPVQQTNVEVLENRGQLGTESKKGGAKSLPPRGWLQNLKIGGAVSKTFLKE
ncbi:hypothetical protein FSHL1_010153 [Fusarium sambucinum]